MHATKQKKTNFTPDNGLVTIYPEHPLVSFLPRLTIDQQYIRVIPYRSIQGMQPICQGFPLFLHQLFILVKLTRFQNFSF